MANLFINDSGWTCPNCSEWVGPDNWHTCNRVVTDGNQVSLAVMQMTFILRKQIREMGQEFTRTIKEDLY